MCLLILLISLANFSENNSPDSQTIHDCLMNLISNLKLELPNLKAFSSDRTSVMTGSKGYVVAKLKERQSSRYLLNVHIYISSDSSNQLNLLNEFELTLTQLWAFFLNSSKRLNIYLKAAHNIHNMETLPG